jgi:hypothetical protein
MKEREQLEVLGVDGKLLLNDVLNRESGRVWSVFTELRIGTIGRLL